MKKILYGVYVWYVSLFILIGVTFTSAQNIDFEEKDIIGGTCGISLTWKLEKNGRLSIAGNGNMIDFDDAEIPWKIYCEAIAEVYVEHGVNRIGNYAFSDCINLKEVKVSDTLKEIGCSAFEGCRYLQTIEIPPSVIKIGDYALGYVNHERKIADFQIKGCVGTIAETYAVQNKILFQPWNDFTRYELQNCTITLSPKTFTYDGKKKEPSILVKNGATTLIQNEDYSLSFQNNLNAGTATVIITGKGVYKGTLKNAFVIQPAKNSIIAQNIIKTTNVSKKLTFSLGVKVDGGSISYQSDNPKIIVSKSGKITVAASYIGKAKIKITAGNTNYRKVTKNITVKINPPKVKMISAVNVSPKTVLVKWKKNALATGYQIQYALDKKFEKSVKTITVKKNSIVTQQLSNLIKGKIYFIRMRTYKKVSGLSFYSEWSDSEKVKITKKNIWKITQYGDANEDRELCYTITTDNGLIIVDGGLAYEENTLRKIIAQYGNHVDAWILTHPHPDHITAFLNIYKNPKGIQIDHVYTPKYPSIKILKQNASWDDFTALQKFRSLKIPEHKYLYIGDEIELLGLKLEVLSAYNDYIDKISNDLMNNGSLVFRISGEQESMIFCGDIGSAGSEKNRKVMTKYVLKKCKNLKADYIQMAHHGFQGLKEDFYKEVNPKGVFMDAPDWLLNGKNERFSAKDNYDMAKKMGCKVYTYYTAPNEIIIR